MKSMVTPSDNGFSSGGEGEGDNFDVIPHTIRRRRRKGAA